MKLSSFLNSPKNRETMDRQKRFIRALFWTQLIYSILGYIRLFFKGHYETWIAYLEIITSSSILICELFFAYQIIFNNLGLKLTSRV